MSEVSCKSCEFNQDWDNKLNYLMETATTAEVSEHTIKFKLHTGTKKVLFFFNSDIYDEYTVWISNKTTHYGVLDEFNNKRLPDKFLFSASQETLDKLHEIELMLKNKNFDYNRIYK